MGDYSGVEELLIIEKYLKNYNHDLVSIFIRLTLYRIGSEQNIFLVKIC